MSPPTSENADRFDLERFVSAQRGAYDDALREIMGGKKRTHWMWFVFPQIDGLGHSTMARRYAITSLDEATAYLAHPVLGVRLREIAEAAVAIPQTSATAVFGSPDDLKLQSCATLFALASAPGSVFERLLEKYFDGERDAETVRLVNTVHDSHVLPHN
jgi:uncharacterized protein (DUF1810 family)